ncbi:S8 family peptidase [Marinirhabdus gelatinilytica]|uniref:Putative secreted protein (Por secretion system target) n=1 Tax=Marinirhabdus gelatinilytica TaxID=1703343 RepID=A0A370QB26_9FLAO|nr:S8 family peptidase [Marinirhabdus gelatinilytica]RDK85573.1 putative secreted protein (Por secretion system target) [Marinirhabdus gelatinilytica]
MKKLILIATVLFSVTAMAQEDALVFFADKEDVAASIANPITILTQEAIDRKAMHNTPIDERDVPVNEDYITQIKNQSGITVHAKSKWLNAVYVRGSQSNINALTNLSFVTEVEFADKGLNLSPFQPPTEDKFIIENQESRITYDYGAATNQTEMLAVDFLHEENLTGEGMIVAVMDSGFPNVLTNDAFADVVSDGRLLGTYDFAERQTNVDGTGSHGARTFSNIGAFLDGDENFVGTAPEASFYLFRTEFGPSENPVEEAWWVEALERADSLGVDVVNTSLGYQDYDNPSYDHSYEDLDGETTIAARGGNIAFEKGMLLVTSAGNDGGGFTFVATPGDSKGILTIGAVDSNGNYASFSSIGPTVDGRIKPDVMAQGQDAAIVNQDGDVTFSSGTSFSSPIMAGAIACLWEYRPEVKNSTIMQLVRESAHLFNNPTDEMGYGIPNFEDAYNALKTLGIEAQLLKETFAIYPNPVTDVFNVSFPQQTERATVSLYNVLGKQVMVQQISAIQNKVDISALSGGVYIASITAEGVTNNFKILKK